MNYPICETCGSQDGLMYDRARRLVHKCPACTPKRNEIRFEEHAFRSKSGTLIDLPLMESLAHRGMISSEILAAAQEEPKSRLLVGGSGIGKTLLSKKIYNDLLRVYEGWSWKIIYRKEYDLFKIFRDQEKTDDFFELLEKRQPEWIIVDEAFHDINWRDKDADRDYARLAHLNYYQFVDWFMYEPRWGHNPNVIMTANNTPARAIGNQTENQRALVRRVEVVTTPAKTAAMKGER